MLVSLMTILKVILKTFCEPKSAMAISVIKSKLKLYRLLKLKTIYCSNLNCSQLLVAICVLKNDIFD